MWDAESTPFFFRVYKIANHFKIKYKIGLQRKSTFIIFSLDITQVEFTSYILNELIIQHISMTQVY